MEEETSSRWGYRRLYFAAFFCLAQRCFCASEIRFLALALKCRLRGCESSELTDPADVFLGEAPSDNAAIALSIRPLSAFNSSTICSVSKSFPPSFVKSVIVAGTQWKHSYALFNQRHSECRKDVCDAARRA